MCYYPHGDSLFCDLNRLLKLQSQVISKPLSFTRAHLGRGCSRNLRLRCPGSDLSPLTLFPCTCSTSWGELGEFAVLSCKSCCQPSFQPYRCMMVRRATVGLADCADSLGCAEGGEPPGGSVVSCAWRHHAHSS